MKSNIIFVLLFFFFLILTGYFCLYAHEVKKIKNHMSVKLPILVETLLVINIFLAGAAALISIIFFLIEV